MSIIQIPQRFSQRWDMASNWTSVNPILWEGEIGFESDTPKWKRGDGTTAWNDLDYSGTEGASAGGVVRPAGTSYTPVLADDGNTILSGSSGPFALTLPSNAIVALRIGAKIAYTQAAAGTITVTGGAGVTVRMPNGNTTGAQWDGGVAEKIDSDEWQLWNGPRLGSLATVNDAPSDGSPYGRKDGAWVVIAGGSGGGISAINEQTGTSYTLVADDATKVVRCTNSSAITLTIPSNAMVALPLLSLIPALQGGAGAITIAPASGVTLEAPSDVVTIGVGDFRTLFQRAANTWVIG